jgi:hypothetical protein
MKPDTKDDYSGIGGHRSTFLQMDGKLLMERLDLPMSMAFKGYMGFDLDHRNHQRYNVFSIFQLCR